MIETFELGDRIAMKKPHACGSGEWVVTRTGADVKIRCLGCGRVALGDRAACGIALCNLSRDLDDLRDIVAPGQLRDADIRDVLRLLGVEPEDEVGVAARRVPAHRDRREEDEQVRRREQVEKLQFA